MKNYYPLFIVILIFAALGIFGMYEMSAVERDILEPAKVMMDKICAGEKAEEEFEKITHEFADHEIILNMYINHSVYNNVAICLTEIGNDMEYNIDAELEADVKRLIYYLEDIIDGEKIKINNIF